MNYSLKAMGLLLAVSLCGCAADDPNRRAKTGAAVGAVVGAVLGHQLDDDSGRYVGAVAGAIAGGAVGHYMDKQQHEFEDALAEERYAHDVEIERLEDESLRLNVPSEVSFDFDRAEIKPAFRMTLDKVADILVRYDRSIVHVIGHTDSVGSDTYNQDLSERRARSVMNYLTDRGVPASRLQAEGRGEREPRDTNATEAGRQLNRRVEIIVKPIVAGQEQDAYQVR